MFTKTRGRLAAPLALLCLASPVLAQQSQDEPLLVLTATRFNESELNVAANIQVITRQDIRAAGAQSLPEVLQQKAGIHIKPLYGALGADTAIDMRGFGEGGSQRTLILLNGQRLNPLDQSAVDWNSIPLDSIQRIEILNGSGAVLFGDNAVGGVINIITGAARPGASITAGFGSHNGRLAAASLDHNDGRFWLSLNAAHQTNDGWRRNNHQEQNNFATRMGFKLEQGELFLDFGQSKTALGLPGTLSESQFRQDPRQAETNNSFAHRNNMYLRPGVKWQLSNALEFAAEISYSDSENKSYISNFLSYDQRQTKTLSFTPRLQWKHGLGSMSSATTFGIDYYDGALTSDKAADPISPITKQVKVDQKSRAFYVHNKTELMESLSLSGGLRRQIVDQQARDNTGLSLTNDHADTIGELGLSYRATESLRLFTRTGTTFRFANLDELTTFAGFASKPVRPEKGRFLDLGLQILGTSYSGKISAYRLKMQDEIALNISTWENENLAKTLRQGLDMEGRYTLNPQWQLGAGLNYQQTKFLEGGDIGKRIPLVPKLKATANLNFKPTQDWNLLLSVNHIGRRYFGSDTANQFTPMPAYTTADFAVSWKSRHLTARLKAQNLFNKCYAPTGFNYGGGASYYPAEGRALFADLRYDF